MKLGIANPGGTGNFIMLDLPLPYDPVIVDLDAPLETQFPGEVHRAIVVKMLEQEGLIQ